MVEPPVGGERKLPLLVAEDGAVNPFYSFARLDFESAAGEKTSAAVVLISRLQQGLLVAVPRQVWHKTPSSRVLPPLSFGRATLCEVAVAMADRPAVVLDESKMKLWIGFLDQRLEGGLLMQEDGDVVDYSLLYADVVDGEDRIPLGQALADVAEDFFSHYHSAAEVPEEEARGSDPMEQRMMALESHLEAVQTSLAELLSHRDVAIGGPKDSPVQRALPGGATPKKAPGEKKAPKVAKGSMEYAGLDPTVLFSARQAGVPESQLRSLSHLMMKSTKMEDQPGRAKTRKKAVNVLSESEAEDEEAPPLPEEGGDAEVVVDPAGSQDGGTPVERAVLQLTKIVGSMARKPARDLEALLDGAEGGSGELIATSGSGGKSKAAAYKRLKAALSDNPSYIYETIEDLMDKDFLQARSAPGAHLGATSSRAWVEHRSKVMNYPSSVRAIWALAAIHDCLKVGAIQEARARAAVSLAAWDQCSLDSGSWLMSQEVLLEPPPPYAAFQSKRLPDPSEQAASRLIDERWLAVLQWKLKDQDNYLETKKRLTQSRGKGDRGAGDDPTPQPKKKGGGKGKDGKGNPREGDAPQS